MMRRILIVLALSFASEAKSDELDRAIALFKAGEVVQAIGLADAMTQSEDAAVFRADMLLRVFDQAERAIEVLGPWEGSERVDVRLAALRGETGGDESKLNCDACRYSDRTVGAYYFWVARATRGRHPDEKFELARFFLSLADHELVEGRPLGRDHARAFGLFRELADAGDPRGMFWVAGMLLSENADEYEDVPVDYETGWTYLNAAASFGYRPAIESLANAPGWLGDFGGRGETDLGSEAPRQ